MVHPRRRRRPLSAGLCRDPRWWDRPDRGRVPHPRPGLVRPARRGHPASADRQRRLLPQPPVAPGLPAAQDHRQANPAPIGRKPTARSSGSTAPWWKAGRIGGCIPAKPPAEPRSDPGCTGIPTTGPTAPSDVIHQSPAVPTSPSPTP